MRGLILLYNTGDPNLIQLSQAEVKNKSINTFFTVKVDFSGIFTWVFIFLTTFSWYSLHFTTNICTFYSLQCQNRLIALVKFS